MRYHDASLDFIDLFFQYGVLSSFLIFIIIFIPVIHIILNIQVDRNSIIDIFISFFEGHIISSAISGIILSLFIGIKYGEIESLKGSVQ